MPDNINVGNPVSSPAVTPVKTDQLGDGTHVQYIKVLDGTPDSSTPVSASAFGLAVDVQRVPDPADPQVSISTGATIAAGGSVSLDSPQISVGKTAYLAALLVSSTVAFKAVLRLVAEGIESADKAIWISANHGWDFRTPGRTYYWVAGTSTVGLDAFRVVVTNLDPSETAAIYVTFLYDQVT